MASTEQPTSSSRILGADGVRAIAALGVVFSHLYQRLNAPAQTDWYQDLHAIFLHGSFGVSTFFVLSGMLLSYPFWMAYLTGKPMPSLSHYARRRAARIIPAYFTSLIVSFGIGLWLFPDAAHAVWRLIAGLTFTSAFRYETFFPSAANGPLWSISFEVVSYVLLPIALAGIFWWRRRSGRASEPGSAKRAVGYWLAALVVVTLLNEVVIRVFTLSDLGKGWEFGDIGGAKEWMPGYNPIGFFGHFGIGVLGALLIASRKARYAAAANTDADKRPAHWRYDIMALVGLGGAATLIWLYRYPAEPNAAGWFQGQPYLWPAFALFMMTLLIGLAHSRWLGRAFDNPFFKYTATVSFGLYVWHYLLLHLFAAITQDRFLYGGIMSWGEHLAISLTMLVVAYTIATLSWRFIEKPALTSRWANAIKRRG